MRFVCEFGHLAQLDRALASEAKGRRFESCNAHRAGDVKAVGQTDGRRTWHSSWLLVLASLLFAVMAVCAKEAAARLPGAQVACMRLSLGAVTVVVLAAGGLKLRPHNLAALLLRGLLGGGAVLFYFVAIAHLPVGVATLLNNSSPLFVAVFSWVFLREPMSLRTLLALLLTSVGVAMVVLGSGSFGGNRPLEWRWVLAALCSAVLAGGAVTTVRAMRKREGSWEIFLAFCLIGSLVTAVPTAYRLCVANQSRHVLGGSDWAVVDWLAGPDDLFAERRAGGAGGADPAADADLDVRLGGGVAGGVPVAVWLARCGRDDWWCLLGHAAALKQIARTAAPREGRPQAHARPKARGE
jgi:drug/metabolite transporter (DMT)-like permease